MTIIEMMTIAGAATAPATEKEKDELCAEVMRICKKAVVELCKAEETLEQLTI